MGEHIRKYTKIKMDKFWSEINKDNSNNLIIDDEQLLVCQNFLGKYHFFNFCLLVTLELEIGIE